MWTWATSEAGAPILGAISFLVTVVGLIVTFWGIRLTYVQAQMAKIAAQSSNEAIEAFKIKVDRYSVYRDIGEALLAIDNTKRHLVNEAWSDAGQSYEIALRAIVRVQQSSIELDSKLSNEIQLVANNLKRFCDRVDAAVAGKGTYPDRGKVMSVMRDHHETLTAVKSAIEREV